MSNGVGQQFGGCRIAGHNRESGRASSRTMASEDPECRFVGRVPLLPIWGKRVCFVVSGYSCFAVVRYPLGLELWGIALLFALVRQCPSGS
jgi:hypothetical protein